MKSGWSKENEKVPESNIIVTPPLLRLVVLQNFSSKESCKYLYAITVYLIYPSPYSISHCPSGYFPKLFSIHTVE